MRAVCFSLLLCLGLGGRATSAVAQPAPEDGGPRRFEVVDGPVDLLGKPGEAAGLLSLTEGAILSNMGCTEQAGAIWCQVRPFRGGPRGFVPSARLRPSRGPDGTVVTGVNDSARRADRQDFDAKGPVLCAQERGQTLGTCQAAVARSGGGDATVVVTFSTGFARRLFFVHGEFVSASATMSGVGRDIDWRLEDGTHFVRVDDQHYEISDEFVFGD